MTKQTISKTKHAAVSELYRVRIARANLQHRHTKHAFIFMHSCILSGSRVYRCILSHTHANTHTRPSQLSMDRRVEKNNCIPSFVDRSAPKQNALMTGIVCVESYDCFYWQEFDSSSLGGSPWLVLQHERRIICFKVKCSSIFLGGDSKQYLLICHVYCRTMFVIWSI